MFHCLFLIIFCVLALFIGVSATVLFSSSISISNSCLIYQMVVSSFFIVPYCYQFSFDSREFTSQCVYLFSFLLSRSLLMCHVPRFDRCIVVVVDKKHATQHNVYLCMLALSAAISNYDCVHVYECVCVYVYQDYHMQKLVLQPISIQTLVFPPLFSTMLLVCIYMYVCVCVSIVCV